MEHLENQVTRSLGTQFKQHQQNYPIELSPCDLLISDNISIAATKHKRAGARQILTHVNGHGSKQASNLIEKV